MIIKRLTTPSVCMIHEGIEKAMAADDAHAGPEKPCGVRLYADWREEADLIEAELSRRGVRFRPLAW